MTTDRRTFMQYLTAAAVGAGAMFKGEGLRAAVVEGQTSAGLGAPWPAMQYRTLGRTGYNASRLFFGCGAALSSRRQDRLLHTAFDAGVNVFDVGFKHYYDDAEKHLAPFLKARRDDIFLISKAYVPIEVEEQEQASAEALRAAARGWTAYLDESLREMQVDHVDAYYFMASFNTSVITSDEMYRAFEDAKAAGKVSYLGLSSHQNTQNVLTAAAESGRFDLAMIAITPGGWYDWENKNVLEGSPPLTELKPVLDKARAAGIGLIGMKAGRFLAGRRFLGWGNPDAFDAHYDEDFLKARLSSFQRSYAYVLEHGLDVVNADMQNMVHLKENFIAAATSGEYFRTA